MLVFRCIVSLNFTSRAPDLFLEVEYDFFFGVVFILPCCCVFVVVAVGRSNTSEWNTFLFFSFFFRCCKLNQNVQVQEKKSDMWTISFNAKHSNTHTLTVVAYTMFGFILYTMLAALYIYVFVFVLYKVLLCSFHLQIFAFLLMRSLGRAHGLRFNNTFSPPVPKWQKGNEQKKNRNT